MEITTLYQKQRKEFGRSCTHFSSTDPHLFEGFVADDRQRDAYVERNPSVLEVQAIPEMSEHEVNHEADISFMPSDSGGGSCGENVVGGGGATGASVLWIGASTVNTERFTYLSVGMFHQEGGWPKDVDPTEKDQTTCAADRMAHLSSLRYVATEADFGRLRLVWAAR
eukprot:6189386-Pleurochrysis_carterae.AAC.1